MALGQYNHKEIEHKWQKQWAEESPYLWDESEKRENSFVIDTPPPTVSGYLHMGHVFSYTQTDFIARFMRMIGKNVFYPIGFDDNGLATERLVEKKKEIKGAQLHREEFRQICKDVVSEEEEEFRKLFRTIALSVDWRQEYRTISDSTIQLSQMSFLDLYNKGLIERRLGPTVWDPVDRTAIAQAEIEDKERTSIMNNIVFKSQSGEDLIIATTRPELIPACVAVFYHPDDERYKDLKGQMAITPIFGAQVTILADSDVDPEKGTGLVMCCTFGDVQDVAWWRKHNLTVKDCVSIEGKMKNSGFLDGLYIKEARSQMLEKLKEEGLLKSQTEIKQMVKCAERSGAPLEIIPTNQWYIKILEKKEEILKMGQKCNWNPDYMRVRFENWVNGLNQDWCISRQRFFGVPFPVWYSKRSGEEGKIVFASVDQLPVDPTLVAPKGYSMNEVIPETDVMDTWATSAITPQINAQAVTSEVGVDTERFAKLFPADLRPQAHEIIRTWAFYTIVKALYHNQTVPWHNLMISGWCLAADKTKMSKSKGNVVTPRDLIDDRGTDCVRYWASTSKLGVDIAYSEDVFKVGNRLINKLWNASKFVEMQIANVSNIAISTVKQDVESGAISCELDKWILSRLYEVVNEATESFKKFEYCDARVAIEEFFWKDFCDNYLELVKARAYGASGEKEQRSAVITMMHVLRTLLLLFAPVMPHITEEIASDLFGFKQSIHSRGTWPILSDYVFDSASLAYGIRAVEIIDVVRKHKSERKVSIKTQVANVVYGGSKLPISIEQDIASAANTVEIQNEEGISDIGVAKVVDL